MKIGLPKAMLYYKYGRLWEQFFAELGQDVVISPDSNSQTLAEGIRYSVDECCLPAKLYMGHVLWLMDKCDRVLVPRIDSYGKNEKVCVKFNAMYDIVKNTFDAPLLTYDIDVLKGRAEKPGFVAIGRELGFGKLKTLKAYRHAKKAQAAADTETAKNEQLRLKKPGLKILVVSHAYNSHDALIGAPVARHIEKLGGVALYADRLDAQDCTRLSQNLSPTLYWTYNKHLAGATELCRGSVDGIVFITAFPCGPDSLITELLLRKLKGVPVCNIVIDELSADAGLETRIESFMDILSMRTRRAV